ncbi:hypothetical protein [Actinokineospora spheciospongiae]|nr:hypothetical protein [Actinokineospora spheciospongiae]
MDGVNARVGARVDRRSAAEGVAGGADVGQVDLALRGLPARVFPAVT